jgi:hypothetical protein
MNTIQLIKHTTRNARRITYYTILWGDGTTNQLTVDPMGTYYIDGQKVTEPELLKELSILIHGER